jgi:Helicase conserved C-terminal domain
MAIDLVTAGERAHDKRVLLLTATPVNTGMEDLVNLLRVLTKNDRGVWAPEIADFERYLDRVDRRAADPFPVLDRAIVRRSRSDILEAYENARAAGQTVAPLKLPTRRTEHISYRYDGAGDDLFGIFADTLRSLSLAPYDLDRFRREAPAAGSERLSLRDAGGREVAPPEDLHFTPGSLAALYAAGLLTRFQSSLPAVRRSLQRLDAVLRRYGEALAQDPPRLLDLQRSPRVRALLRDETTGRDRDADEPTTGEGLADEELKQAWAEALDAAPELDDAPSYCLDRVQRAIAQDREAVGALLDQLPVDADDGKFDALLAALTTEAGRKGAPGLARRRVLIFSQFRDTARYLHRRLTEPPLVERVGPVMLTDGAVPPAERARITAFFDPDRAADADLQARGAGEEPPRVLISTDVLAEGHNLQLADTVVNFDLHFNPQVAVQRAGRVDRLNSPHPVVWLVSMLPPEALDRHIGLLGRLDERFRRIHGLGLGDEKVMPLAADVQGQTLEQIRRLYADDASVLDEIERSWTFGSTDYMRIPLATFLNTAGLEQLAEIPVGVASVKRLPPDWRHGEGIFLAFAAPASASEQRETYWRFYPRLSGGYGDAVMDDVEIFRAIACYESEPRAALHDVPNGPGIFDWDLVGRASRELAEALTLRRSQAELQRGASERSRKLRNELRANAAGLDIEGLDDLLERLLQVRVEDYDARSGWRAFDDARRALRRAETEGERYRAAADVAQRGIDLLGRPVAEDEDEALTQIAADDLQLVSYEALVAAPGSRAPGEQTTLGV